MSINTILVLSLLNGTSMRAARVLLVLYALELDAQPLAVGVLAAVFSVCPMLLAVPTGRLADRFGVRGLLMCGAAAGGLGMLVPSYLPVLAALFLAAALIGLLDVFDVVSLQNLVGLLSTPHTRTRNFSNYSLVRSTASLAGPLLAGFSVDLAGHAAACFYLALLALLPIAVLVFGNTAPRGNSSHQIFSKGSGIRSMLKEPGVRDVLVTGCLLSTGRDMFQLYLPVYAYAAGHSASTIGILLALNAAAEFGVQVLLPRLTYQFNEVTVLTYSFYVGAASLILVPFFSHAAMLALISFLFGLGAGCGGPIITMLMFGNAPKGHSAEALGLRMSVNHVTRLVGPLLFGSIGSAFGLSPIFWINALMLGAGGVLNRTKSHP